MASDIFVPIEPIQVAPLLDILAPDDIRIHGHRIGIEHIVFAFNRGETAEEIVQRFPGLDLRTVYTLIAYYLTYRDNRSLKRLITRPGCLCCASSQR